jgi:hypothetical protein
MKKLIIIGLLAFSAKSFAQTAVENGTIYKEHPYITAVKEEVADFAKGDTVGAASFYADSVKFYDSPEPTKPYGIKQARASWQKIFTDWGMPTIKQVGYPDGLQYTSDPFTVQSWWEITVVNIKTQKTAKFEQVVFDTFNKDGKITVELSYYDTSAIKDAMK